MTVRAHSANPAVLQWARKSLGLSLADVAERVGRPVQDVQAWEAGTAFIHTHHFEIHRSAYDSSILNHPRRTGEAYINQYLNAYFIESNPVPRDLGFDRLWSWFEALFAAERVSNREHS